MYLLGTLQHPRIWHKFNGGGAAAQWFGGSNKSSAKTVYRDSMNCGVGETVPVHRRLHKLCND